MFARDSFQNSMAQAVSEGAFVSSIAKISQVVTQLLQGPAYQVNTTYVWHPSSPVST